MTRLKLCNLHFSTPINQTSGNKPCLSDRFGVFFSSLFLFSLRLLLHLCSSEFGRCCCRRWCISMYVFADDVFEIKNISRTFFLLLLLSISVYTVYVSHISSVLFWRYLPISRFHFSATRRCDSASSKVKREKKNSNRSHSLNRLAIDGWIETMRRFKTMCSMLKWANESESTWLEFLHRTPDAIIAAKTQEGCTKFIFSLRFFLVTKVCFCQVNIVSHWNLLRRNQNHNFRRKKHFSIIVQNYRANTHIWTAGCTLLHGNGKKWEYFLQDSLWLHSTKKVVSINFGRA